MITVTVTTKNVCLGNTHRHLNIRIIAVVQHFSPSCTTAVAVL